MDPSPFESILGQSTAIALLRAAISHDRIAPAYLFVGKEGIGKSLVAKAFAETLIGRPLINHPDVLWIEPTYQEKGKLISVSEAQNSNLSPKGKPQIRVEQIRGIGEFLSHPPLMTARSVVIIEDAHTMAESSGNALLKTLEEPGKATIVLIAPQVSALLPTLTSRCQKIPFAPLSAADLVQVLQPKGYDPLPPWLILLSQGSPGIATLVWENLRTIPDELLQSLTRLPFTIVESLTLAKRISQELDLSTQLWLIDYLQWQWWEQGHGAAPLQRLEQAKQWLNQYVQPRLVWEITLRRG